VPPLGGDGEVAADGGCGACTRRWGSKYPHAHTRTTDVHRRWGSVFWRSWARVIRGRLPVIGRPNADILHHGPPPAYAHGREAVGGAEAWPQCTPASCAGHARRQACERLSAGWRVPAEPTMLRLNSHFLGF
jgi:hypothetical protein